MSTPPSSPQTSRLFPPVTSLRKIDTNQQQQSSSPLLAQITLADVIQIIKSDETVLCSYQPHQHVEVCKLVQIRREIIEHSRKLPLEAYENDITESIFQGFYVCFRIHQGAIFYILNRSTYSYPNAQEIINNLIAIFDQTVFEVFGQRNLPKNLSHSHFYKLQTMRKKIREIIRHLILHRRKATILNGKTHDLVRSFSEDSLMLGNRKGYLKHNQKSTQKMLKSSLQLKEESKRLSKWMALKKYLLFLFLVICFVIACYMVWKWQ